MTEPVSATAVRRPLRPTRRLLSGVANTVALVVGTLIVLPVYLVLLLPAGLVILAVVRLARLVRPSDLLPAQPMLVRAEPRRPR